MYEGFEDDLKELELQKEASSSSGSKDGNSDEKKENKMPLPRISNIISNMDLQIKLDLKVIATKARNAVYNPKRYPGLVIRIRDPKTTALVFESGKVTLLGSRNPVYAKTAAKKFVRIIRKVGYPKAKFSKFNIANISGSVCVPFQIRIDDLAEDHYHYASYEPELFPGLIYRMIKPKAVLTIFASGQVDELFTLFTISFM